MATNWKKLFEEAEEQYSYACTKWDEFEAKAKKASAFKGQLTRERKKNAEARELVELLEWAKKNKIYIEIHRDGDVYIEDTKGISCLSCPEHCGIERLPALRAAKKEVERVA